VQLGLISDTTGTWGTTLRALAGSDAILHAGDVGSGVLVLLREVAPVVAVRGNTDVDGEAADLPEVAFIEAGGQRIAIVHRLLDAPWSEGWDVLVYGHCHRQHADREGERLLLNPGAAGRRGFHTRRSVARLSMDGTRMEWEFVDLGARASGRA
jgi:putative phosphoesterase